ncbi:MAG: DUF5666 domain-containing protein [Patescibacteria group bacterium]|nr:DUF5666 domain-containing protein [Patescibacteria group bacterium]
MRKMKFFLPVALFLAFFVFAGSADAKSGNGIQLKNALITSVDDRSNTVIAAKDGTEYAIDVSNATIRRRYGAKCDFYELMTGDYIWVWGTMSGTNITAGKVKDMSIQKWKGSFVGTITSIDSATYTDGEGKSYQQFEIESRHRGDQIIRVYSTTSIKYRGKAKTFSDLAIGQEVVAKGTWNNTHSFVYDTNWVKIRTLAE